MALLKAVYLGNWMANAYRVEGRKKEYEEIEDYIFSHAKKFGFSKYVDDELMNEGRFFPTRQFEGLTDVESLRQEYDDETFWDELIHRLAWRDVVREYGEKSVQKMDGMERVTKIDEARKKYEEIFCELGLDAVEVKDNYKNKS